MKSTVYVTKSNKADSEVIKLSLEGLGKYFEICQFEGGEYITSLENDKIENSDLIVAIVHESQVNESCGDEFIMVGKGVYENLKKFYICNTRPTDHYIFLYDGNQLYQMLDLDICNRDDWNQYGRIEVQELSMFRFLYTALPSGKRFEEPIQVPEMQITQTVTRRRR